MAFVEQQEMVGGVFRLFPAELHWYLLLHFLIFYLTQKAHAVQHIDSIVTV